jgi:hypothetical protein
VTFTAYALQFLPLSGGTLTGGLTLSAGNLSVSAGNISASGNVQSLASFMQAAGVIDVSAAGSGLQVKEGANAKQGTAVLVAGTVTVANTSVTANSRILLTGQVLGGTAGGLNVTSRVAGTSFTVTSTNAADTSTFAYEIFEPG